MAHDARVRQVPDEYQLRAKELAAQHGLAAAARLLGVSTSALLRILAGTPVMPGTLSLIRDALGRPTA